MKTVSITPTWREILPALIEVAANAENPNSRKVAMDELLRLADIADGLKQPTIDPEGSFEEVRVTCQAPMEMPHDEIAGRLTRAVESALGVGALVQIAYEADIYSGGVPEEIEREQREAHLANGERLGLVNPMSYFRRPAFKRAEQDSVSAIEAIVSNVSVDKDRGRCVETFDDKRLAYAKYDRLIGFEDEDGCGYEPVRYTLQNPAEAARMLVNEKLHVDDIGGALKARGWYGEVCQKAEVLRSGGGRRFRADDMAM